MLFLSLRCPALYRAVPPNAAGDPDRPALAAQNFGRGRPGSSGWHSEEPYLSSYTSDNPHHNQKLHTLDNEWIFTFALVPIWHVNLHSSADLELPLEPWTPPVLFCLLTCLTEAQGRLQTTWAWYPTLGSALNAAARLPMPSEHFAGLKNAP